MGQGDGYAKMIRHGSNRLPTTDGPAHQVQITQPFYFSVYEITAAQWQHVMGSLPEGYDDSPDCPITRTSWNEATAFCRKVSGMVELDVRLPKEKEWEYCAIAGDPYPAAAHHKCWLGNCWDLLSSDARLHPVGQKTPNPWGIFDLLGNASEMCESRFERYPGSEFSVPARFQRVIRGGSYKKNGPTPKYRIGIQEEEKREDLGFRLVLSVSSDE
jgi:formylglycine-generating enzyme required for sulfatase activity